MRGRKATRERRAGREGSSVGGVAFKVRVVELVEVVGGRFAMTVDKAEARSSPSTVVVSVGVLMSRERSLVVSLAVDRGRVGKRRAEEAERRRRKVIARIVRIVVGE